jgi:hypothetical protein
VCSQDEVCLPSSDLLRAADDYIVANDCAEAIDLGTELDLDDLSLLQLGGCLFGVGLEGCVWGDVGARRDGGAVADALDDLLALVDLSNFLLQELVTALAELDDAGVSRDPS